MLHARNLDDQTYEEIVKTAVGRLPWLCPVWTDHNAHDPGITILELMAWYKELQQYHMNQIPEAMERKLLKLAGIALRPAAPARCPLEVQPQDPPRPAGARLYTAEEIPFELAEPIPARRPQVRQVWVDQEGRLTDVGRMLAERHITFQPFGADSRRPAALRIGLSGWTEGPLRLWFDVEPPGGVARNPFAGPEQVPRIIGWHCEGAEGTRVLRDDTHALSQSGYVTLEPRGTWSQDAEGLRWLVLTMEDPGCEESVRLSGLTAGRFEALQQETWAKSFRFLAEERTEWTACLTDGQARNSELAVFLRKAEGWVQTSQWSGQAGPEGRCLKVHTAGVLQDGEENVHIVSLDPLHLHSLLFDAKGLPGETLRLDLKGRRVLTGSFTLLCNTLDRDGKTRPMLWRCVEDLASWGPRDHVFTYDSLRETITFGDGAHGSLLQRGAGAVLAADMVLSCGGGGNIPGGCGLRFEADGQTAVHGPAAGGADPESVLQARERLLRQLSTTRKCVSREDYERLTRETPGLRVAAAKAIPAYDPEEPAGRSTVPTVTVVAVPAGTGERPMPDGRFLAAVQRQLDRYRPVGIQVKAVAPVYVDLSLHATLRTSGPGPEGEAEEALRAWLAGTEIGGVLRGGDVQAVLQALPGVLQVREVRLHSTHSGCVRGREGELLLPRRAIPRLGRLQLVCLPQEGSGR